MPRIPRRGDTEDDPQAGESWLPEGDTGETAPPPADVRDPAPEAATTETPAAAGAPPAEEDVREREQGRVSVVSERPTGDGEEEEYRWHTGENRPTGVADAIEFVDVHKAFGRNRILRGLNMGIPEEKISMILGPSGTGKSVCIKHMVGLLYPDEGAVIVDGEAMRNLSEDE